MFIITDIKCDSSLNEVRANWVGYYKMIYYPSEVIYFYNCTNLNSAVFTLVNIEDQKRVVTTCGDDIMNYREHIIGYWSRPNNDDAVFLIPKNEWKLGCCLDATEEFAEGELAYEEEMRAVFPSRDTTMYHLRDGYVIYETSGRYDKEIGYVCPVTSYIYPHIFI